MRERERDRKKNWNEPFIPNERKIISLNREHTIGMVWFYAFCIAVHCVLFFQFFVKFSMRYFLLESKWNETKRNESNSIQSKMSTTHSKLNVIHISVYQVFYWLGFTVFFSELNYVFTPIVITRSLTILLLFLIVIEVVVFAIVIVVGGVDLAYDFIVNRRMKKKTRV